MLPTWYPALVALHLISMVTFFASTFCLLRLLVLHGQAQGKQEPERALLLRHSLVPTRMLLYVVGWPSLVLLILTGGWMIWFRPALLAEAWVQAKLGLTGLLAASHLMNQRLLRKAHKGEPAWGVTALRLWTPYTVLLLCVLVLLSAFQEVQWYIGVLGLLVLALLLHAAIRGFSRKAPVGPSGTGLPGS
ncbi:MAG: CopD family protein [Flavobacteriales bacterium]|nr:CopD family protein [Flavobacteriales bacterium]